jgi:hypothetical protein
LFVLSLLWQRKPDSISAYRRSKHNPSDENRVGAKTQDAA